MVPTGPWTCLPCSMCVFAHGLCGAPDVPHAVHVTQPVAEGSSVGAFRAPPVQRNHSDDDGNVSTGAYDDDDTGHATDGYGGHDNHGRYDNPTQAGGYYHSADELPSSRDLSLTPIEGVVVHDRGIRGDREKDAWQQLSAHVPFRSEESLGLSCTVTLEREPAASEFEGRCQGDGGDGGSKGSCQLRVCTVIERGREVSWRCQVKRSCLFVHLSKALAQEGSKEGFVTLLEFASESLHLPYVVAQFERDRQDFPSLVKMLMFLGFQPLPPTHRLLGACSPSQGPACRAVDSTSSLPGGIASAPPMAQSTTMHMVYETGAE